MQIAVEEVEEFIKNERIMYARDKTKKLYIDLYNYDKRYSVVLGIEIIRFNNLNDAVTFFNDN